MSADFQVITFWIAVVGTIFAVYHHFRNPQIKNDKDEALLSQKIDLWQEAIESRFQQMQKNFEGLVTQNQNHIHTVDTKVEMLTTNVVAMGNSITKLATIIEERIPKK